MSDILFEYLGLVAFLLLKREVFLPALLSMRLRGFRSFLLGLTERIGSRVIHLIIVI